MLGGATEVQYAGPDGAIPDRQVIRSAEVQHFAAMRRLLLLHSTVRHNVVHACVLFCMCAGVVPGVPEANHNEPLLPWGRYHQGRVVLGSRVEDACATPADLHHAATMYKQEKFVVCYRADKKKVRHVGRRRLATRGAGPAVGVLA